MIEKLKKKFIIITMSSISLVMFVIMGCVNILNYYTIYSDSNKILDILSNNHGEFRENIKWDEPWQQGTYNKSMFSPETPYETRFFSVVIDKNGDPIRTHTKFVSLVTDSKAKEFAKTVLSKGKSKGIINFYLYKISDYNDRKLIVFMDCSNQLSIANIFLLTSIGICIVGLILVFILVLIFSNKAIKPIVESYEKQLRFITDSSHEIKTPLAVIGANVEVIEIIDGESEWTKSIKNQVLSLSKLNQGLTTLARMYENHESLDKSKFSITEAVEDTVYQFLHIAKKKEKKINLNIKDNINYTGNEEMLRRLISILIDNAIKYGKEEINVLLYKKKNKIIIDVYNDVNKIPKGNLDYYFDRFYRGDSSRSKETEGFGIGLSIAKEIVEIHEGKITAYSEDGEHIHFLIYL